MNTILYHLFADFDFRQIFVVLILHWLHISRYLGELLLDQLQSECLHHFVLQSIVFTMVCV